MEDLVEAEYVFVFKHPGRKEDVSQLPSVTIKEKAARQLNQLVIMVARWIFLIVF